MADLIRVIPAEGRLVRDLQGVRIPDVGAVVDRSTGPVYWHRLERAGDVTVETVTEAQSAPQPAPAEIPASEE